MILDYILELKKSGLSMSLIKVHLCGNCGIPLQSGKVDEFLIFAHSITKRFLMGLHNLYPEYEPTLYHGTSVWCCNAL